ncbi:MAG: hypothetical protein RSG52_06225 [Terrisporobacter sp.]|uniref:hypothetical protein n=1 Tax=Terrisporobacter sp. TaxID=1965305 RepID=UPI002FC7DED6
MTALELIISISLIALICSICFVKFQGDNYKINSFAKQLCCDIRYVRRENMLDNGNVYISFINENNRNGYVLRRNGSEDKRVYLPQNTKLEYPIGTNGTHIKFNRTGTFIQGGGTITINKGNDYKYITIVPVSGRVLYKEGIYEK